MKKLLLTMLLLVATTASAEWTIVSGSHEFLSYMDMGTIRRNGNFVKIWGLLDHFKEKTQGTIVYLSEKTLEEYDCKEERYRTVAYVQLRGKMGTGTVVGHNSDIGKWIPISPDSVAQTWWKIACGKK